MPPLCDEQEKLEIFFILFIVILISVMEHQAISGFKEGNDQTLVDDLLTIVNIWDVGIVWMLSNNRVLLLNYTVQLNDLHRCSSEHLRNAYAQLDASLIS